jgi:hypothetical protein
VCVACLNYSVLIFVEKIYKMQHLDGSGAWPSYIQDARFLKVNAYLLQSPRTFHTRLIQCGLCTVNYSARDPDKLEGYGGKKCPPTLRQTLQLQMKLPRCMLQPAVSNVPRLAILVPGHVHSWH